MAKIIKELQYYYIAYEPKADIDYSFLFSLYDYSFSSFGYKKGQNCVIKYTSIANLAKAINSNSSKLNREFSKPSYASFLSFDSLKKEIVLYNTFGAKGKPFVVLSRRAVDTVRGDNLFCKYLIYLKY